MKANKPFSPAQKRFLLQYYRHHRLVLLMRFLLLFLFLIIWELASRQKWIDSFIFCSPSILLHTAGDMIRDGSLFWHTGITLSETFISFFLTAFLGILTAMLLWYFPTLAEITEPYLITLNSLPKSALAPLLIVWLGARPLTIVVAGISVSLFSTILTLYTGFRQVDYGKCKMIASLHGNRRQLLSKLILPANIPLIISSLKINIGLSLIGVIIGEFIGARQGLGYLIIYGTQVFHLDWVLLSISILCGISILFYQGISFLERKICRHFQQP